MIRNDGSDYTFAADGQLATMSNAIVSVEYHYTPDRLDAGYTLTLINGVSVTHSLMRDTYRRSLVTGIESSVGGNVIESFAYSYDALNRPTTRNADSFGYNDRSEVTSATIGGNFETHEYDSIGNSIIASFNGTTNTYSANNLNQYTTVGRVVPNAPPCSVVPTYDIDGNMTQCGDWTYTYDAANRLKTVSVNGVLVSTNFYDAKSRRVRKVTSEAATTFFYDDWNLIEERIAYTNGASSTIHYYWGKDLSGTLQGAGGVGGLLYLTVDGEVYIPCYDNNGNITRYLDAFGNTVAQYTYDAFGNTISQSGPHADLFRHRFSTKYFDIETGLYYYGYRFYHPVLMRWLTRDPLEEEGGVNLYVFCSNNTLENVDILGMKISKRIEKKLNEMSIPRYSNGTGRGSTQVNLSGVAVSCKNCRLQVSGSYEKVMYVLAPSRPEWGGRLPRYDKKWGKPRSNDREREATIAHENDHWDAWAEVETYIDRLNSMDGSFLFFCSSRANRMHAELKKLIDEATSKSRRFDTAPGMNQGGMR